jgi:hypothetical protein
MFSPGSGIFYSTDLEACADPYETGLNPGWLFQSVNSAHECIFISPLTSPPQRMLALFVASPVQRCATGYNLQGSAPNQTCIAADPCPTGWPNYDAAANQCWRPLVVTCTAGTYISGYVPTTTNPAFVCNAGCEATVSTVSNGYKTTVAVGSLPIGTDVYAGIWITNGVQCTSNNPVQSGTSNPTTTPQTCTTSGMGYISSGSNTVCVPTGTTASGVPAASSVSAASSVTSTSGVNCATTPADPACTGTGSTSGVGTGTGTGTGAGTGTGTMDCPTCAKEGTLLGLIDWLKNTTGYNTDFTSNRDALKQHDADLKSKLQTVADDADKQQTNDETFIDSIFHFAPVANGCQPWSGTIRGKSVSIDICKYTEYIRELLAWLFALFGAYQIFQIIFKPKA